jgi:transcriptional regulator with XRE-family HTH domain
VLIDLLAIARRARTLRLHHNLSQAELARRAGVGLATVQRFEATGQAGFDVVARLGWVLRAEGQFDGLFSLPAFQSIDEALAQEAIVTRQRARRRR